MAPSPFAHPLRVLAVTLSLEDELAGMEAPQALNYLHERSLLDEVFSLRLLHYVTGQIRFQKLQLGEVDASRDLSGEAATYLFNQLVKGVAHRFFGQAPKIHHWLPYTYLNRFASGKKPTKRSCNVNAVDFASEPAGLASNVRDAKFTHGLDSLGNGFYHLSMEFFFSLIECDATCYMSFYYDEEKSVNLYAKMVHLAFFIVQSVRNPHPTTHTFSLRDIEGVVRGLEVRLAALPVAVVTFARTQRSLPFTPYVPPRIRVLVTGEEVFFFALAPRMGMLVSSRALNFREAALAVSSSRRAIIAQARREGKTVYGVRLSQL